jgi:cobalt-zinc-cadmium efflux system membrane fusion protein
MNRIITLAATAVLAWGPCALPAAEHDHDDHDGHDHAAHDGDAHDDDAHDDDAHDDAAHDGGAHDDAAHDGDGHDHDAHGHDTAAPVEPGHDGHAHGKSAHGDPGHDDHDDHGSELVPLSAEMLAEFEIDVAVAAAGDVETYVTLPGEVRANADRLAHIVPRFSGIVVEVRANVGDIVSKGQVLAIVESDESLAPFEVRTLIPGTVIEKHIALGEAVSRDRDTFVIADLSTVWVELTVYQRDLERVRAGQSVRVFVGHDPWPDEGVLRYVTPIVNEATRTATARLELRNESGRWRPGMFVRGRILVGSARADVAVPETALHTYEGETVVFVETDEGFEPRPVQVGLRGEEIVAIDAGLTAGERYVSRGGFTIKAELGRESLGHAGHAH